MIKVTTLGNYSVYSEKLGIDILGSYCKSEKGCELFKYLLVNYEQKIKKNVYWNYSGQAWMKKRKTKFKFNIINNTSRF